MLSSLPAAPSTPLHAASIPERRAGANFPPTTSCCPPRAAPPNYPTLAGTSRRFGFAKFVDRESAQAALDALRGRELHGKQLDLKHAVALEDPEPGNGVLPKQRAKLRVSACGWVWGGRWAGGQADTRVSGRAERWAETGDGELSGGRDGWRSPWHRASVCWFLQLSKLACWPRLPCPAFIPHVH